MTKLHKMEVTESNGVQAVFLNDVRITPRKTQQEGGIKTLHSFKIDHDLLLQAIEGHRYVYD